MPFTGAIIPRSTYVKSFEFTGPRVPYPEPDIKGDTYPLTWAADGKIYASSGDPAWGGKGDGLDMESFDGGPTDYKITKRNQMMGYHGVGGDGHKPTGMISVGGTLYLAVQNLRRMRKPPFNLASQHGSDAHIVYSCDHGFKWAPAIETVTEPMFPGSAFGGPAFINYGQDNAGARDGHVYAVSADQWDNGSNLRLGRVPAGRIVERSAWEFVAAWTAQGEPVWHGDLALAIPVLSLHRMISSPEMVYLSGIRRYLLLSWRLHQDFTPFGSDLLVLEAPEPWGPFSWVHAETPWEDLAYSPYCPRVPLKWMAPDHRSGWLQFSGSWSGDGQKAGGSYRSNVRPFRLTL